MIKENMLSRDELINDIFNCLGFRESNRLRVNDLSRFELENLWIGIKELGNV